MIHGGQHGGGRRGGRNGGGHGGGHGGRHGGGHDDRHGGHQRFLSQTFLRPINNLMDSFTNYFKVLVFLIQLSTLFFNNIP